jgi:hypothetical protein
MAIVRGYTTLTAALSHLGLPVDSPESPQVERYIEAASRRVDGICHRHFYTVSETRVFTPTASWYLVTGDILAITGLATDNDGDRVYEVAWDTDLDFYLGPEGALAGGTPYWFVELDRLGRYTFPVARRSVQITGTWGYSESIPPLVEQATLRLVGRNYSLRQAPLGVAGSGETGFIRVQTDRDVEEMLAEYRLVTVG